MRQALRCLKLAEWDGEYLIPLNKLANASFTSDEFIKGVIADRTLDNGFLRIVDEALKKDPSAPALKVGNIIAERINRKWSDSSAKRYGETGLKWNRTISSWKS